MIDRLYPNDDGETASILADKELMESIRKGEEDVEAGRVPDAADVFAELDAEFCSGCGEPVDERNDIQEQRHDARCRPGR